LLSAATAGAALLALGPTLVGAQGAARWTARCGFAFFALAFAAPALVVLLPAPGTRALAAREWPLTQAFIGAHLVHLAALLVYVSLAGHDLDPLRLAGGVLAYGLLGLVLFRPGARSWAFFYVWFVFFMTYWPRVQGRLPDAGGDPRGFPFLLAVVLSLLVLRLAALGRGVLQPKEG
jgi:hypothetical protein